MRDNIKYTAGEIGRVRLVEDFLPPPADLFARSKKDLDGRDKPGHDEKGK